MAQLPDGWDASQVAPFGSDPIPAGEYIAKIIHSENRPTKAGDGAYLAFTFEVTQGEYAGSTVMCRLNLVNQNETTVRIARGQLSAICRAVGVLTPQDSTELHEIPLLIKVSAQQDALGNMTNDVKAFKAAPDYVPEPESDSKPWGGQ